jgi:hypothetical protein
MKEEWGVYFFPERNKDDPAIKIGYSIDPRKRLKQLQTGHPTKIGCEGWWKFDTEKEAVDYETYLHDFFKKDRIRYNGEWFNYTESIRNYLLSAYPNSSFCRYYY